MIIYEETSYSPTTYFHNVSFDILVNGRAIKQYSVKDKIFVEGRKESNYSIRVKNTNSTPVLAVVSVDGLSVIDGKPASENSKGWIINAFDEVVIPGWLVDDKQAAKFEFQGKKESYVAASGKDANNAGVIGCLIFEQKKDTWTKKVRKYNDWYEDYVKPAPYIWPHPWNAPYYGSSGPYYVCNTLTGSSGPVGGGDSGASGGTTNTVHSMNGFSASAMNCSYSPDSATLSAASESAPRSMGISGQSTKGILRSAMKSERKTLIPEEKLGTGFGDATEFKTDTASFNRGNKIGTFVLYYDSKKNLEKLGVIFERRNRENVQPNPFPASTGYCKPPRNW